LHMSRLTPSAQDSLGLESSAREGQHVCSAIRCMAPEVAEEAILNFRSRRENQVFENRI
jgi:hypothetical protein